MCVWISAEMRVWRGTTFFWLVKSQWSRSRMKRKAMALMGNVFFPPINGFLSRLMAHFFCLMYTSSFVRHIGFIYETQGRTNSSHRIKCDDLRKNGLRTTQELVLLVFLNEAHSHGSKELTCTRLDHWSKVWCICMNVWLLSPRGLDGQSSTSSVVPLEQNL